MQTKMQAKELMIGDLIKQGRVNGIGVDFVFVEGDARSIYDKKVDGIFKHDEIIEPIPLTAEILELNGFGSIDIKNVSTIIKLNGDKLSWTGSITRGKLYVHEFQHILRICGMSEVADNFKVE